MSGDLDAYDIREMKHSIEMHFAEFEREYAEYLAWLAEWRARRAAAHRESAE